MASTDLTSIQMSPHEDIVGVLKPSQLRAILEELAFGQPTLRAIPRHQRIEGLVQTVRALKNEESAIYQRLITECADQISWSEAMTKHVLDDLLKLISTPSLTTLLHDELGPETNEDRFQSNPWRATLRYLRPPEVVVHILAATVPTTPIEAILLSIAAGVPCLIRSSEHERAAGRFFLSALRKVAPELADHVAVVTWPSDDELFSHALAHTRPQIVFHGSDESIHNFRCSVPDELQIQAMGHRISFGVLAPDGPLTRKTLLELCDQIALDATLFEGMGCMSLQTLFVLPHPSQKDLARTVARILVEQSFPKIEATFPRQPLPIDIAAAHMQQLGVVAFAGKAFQGSDGNALLWKEVELRSSPGWRHLHVCNAPHLDAVFEALAPYRDNLSTAGMYLPQERAESVAKLLAQSGVRRICRFGHMQRPIFLRAHDGQPRLRAWFQSCDLEGAIL